MNNQTNQQENNNEEEKNKKESQKEEEPIESILTKEQLEKALKDNPQISPEQKTLADQKIFVE